MTKTAFFRGADGENHPKLLKDNVCTVPAEALAVPGRVGVSVSGTLGETVITTDIKSSAGSPGVCSRMILTLNAKGGEKDG